MVAEGGASGSSNIFFESSLTLFRSPFTAGHTRWIASMVAVSRPPLVSGHSTLRPLTFRTPPPTTLQASGSGHSGPPWRLVPEATRKSPRTMPGPIGCEQLVCMRAFSAPLTKMVISLDRVP